MVVIAHPVKCYYCGSVFDRDKVECVQIEGKKRYAHMNCHCKAKEVDAKTEADKTALEEYIKELFNYKTLPETVNKQIRQYVSENNYTYSGILKSLKFFYEIKHGDKEKAYGRIGIVPYVYQDAFNYYYALWETQQKNETTIKEESTLDIPVIEVRIPPPKRITMRTRKRLFTFLNEEVEE